MPQSHQRQARGAQITWGSWPCCLGPKNKNPTGQHSGGAGGARDQAAWDELFNKFIECGEDWTKCDLVTKSVTAHEKAHTGTWALMSKKEIYLKLDTC